MKSENTVVIMPAVYDDYVTVTILDNHHKAIAFNVFKNSQIFGDISTRTVTVDKSEIERNMLGLT